MPPLPSNKKAEKFKSLADSLEAKIQYYREPAIASNAVTYNQKEPYASFRTWLSEVGGAIAKRAFGITKWREAIEPQSDRAFLTSFRPTSVKTVMITIDREFQPIPTLR